MIRVVTVELDDIRAAADRIADVVVRTPTVDSPGLSALLGTPAVVKLESLQRTGSFKARGVAAKLTTLDAADRERGVVTVSGGNHGIALAVMAGELDIAATIVMPRSAPQRAVDIAIAAGASVEVTDSMAEAFARVAELHESGLTLVHPFDDPIVLAGQGTVGLELAEAAPRVTDVLVSIGGGGLISGVAIAVRALLPSARIWGVEVTGADAMSRARSTGAPVTFTPTSAISTLSAPTVSRLTYDYVTTLVEDVLVYADDQATDGTVQLAEHGKIWAEPAAGCLLPAARDVVTRVGDSCRLALVICGGNLTPADFAGYVGSR